MHSDNYNYLFFHIDDLLWILLVDCRSTEHYEQHPFALVISDEQYGRLYCTAPSANCSFCQCVHNTIDAIHLMRENVPFSLITGSDQTDVTKNALNKIGANILIK